MGQNNTKLTKIHKDPKLEELQKAAETNGFFSTAVGPISWAILHSIALNFPYDIDKKTESEKASIRQHYKNYLKEFAHVYPCGNCRSHFLKHVSNIPDSAFTNRTSFFRYLYNLHNTVTKEVEGRCPDKFKTQTLTEAQAFALFESLRCLPSKVKKGEKVYCVIRFQSQPPKTGHSIEIEKSIALSSSKDIEQHILNGGWMPNNLK